jgi:hypothetical protein
LEERLSFHNVSLRERTAHWLRPAVYLGSNRLTLAGAVFTTSSAITLIAFWVFEVLSSSATHPYVGVIVFLILPGIFVLGLVLMPIGIFWRRRGLVASGEIPTSYPAIDFSRPVLRSALGWVAGLTAANVVVFGIASYRGVEYMDSVNFCGQTCHTVMEPEFTAYQVSPHQRVSCVQCHIGPGAGWFARSKLSGVRQVVAVALHTYAQPIPSPLQQLRPARETCEQCHWPQKFTGDKLVVRTSYAEDEKNTLKFTVLMLKLGGQAGQAAVGIHGRHLDVRPRVQYIATGRRQTIPRVTYLDDSGQTLEFTSGDDAAVAEALRSGERRIMDCLDCHNRPSHSFQLPGPAVDQALAESRIQSDLPFVKKKAVEVLNGHYPTREAATREIAAVLNEFYRTSYPELYHAKRPVVEEAVRQVQAIYSRNVFPEMNITWGTYPDNVAHTDFPGCFRCHDGSHTTADGRTITNDCSACHTLLAVDDPNPQILSELELQ